MGVRLPETMAGIHYLLFIFVSLYNIDNSRAFGDGACKGVTVGDCQLLDEYVIETLSIGISADLCQDICQQKTIVWYFNIAQKLAHFSQKITGKIVEPQEV